MIAPTAEQFSLLVNLLRRGDAVRLRGRDAQRIEEMRRLKLVHNTRKALTRKGIKFLARAGVSS